MLRLFHMFKIRNTNIKVSYYEKLQQIFKKLEEFRKNKNYCNLSTYIHHFLEQFGYQVKSEMEKLEESLVLTLTA